MSDRYELHPPGTAALMQFSFAEPNARHSDPDTSHLAAADAKRGAPYTRKLRPAFACYQNRACPIGTSQSTVLEGSLAKQVRAHDLHTPHCN